MKTTPAGDDETFDERIRSDRRLMAQLHARNASSEQGKAVLNEAMATIRRLLGSRHIPSSGSNDG